MKYLVERHWPDASDGRARTIPVASFDAIEDALAFLGDKLRRQCNAAPYTPRFEFESYAITPINLDEGAG